MTDYQVVEMAAEPFLDSALLRFPHLMSVPGFAHVVTTRPWNMAPHRGPQKELAIDRRRKICGHIGLPFDRLTAADQIHSAHVLRIEPSDVGAGRETRESAMRFTDGLVCDLPGVAVMQFSADCPLIVLVDPGRRVLGTAHASWRGTVAGIATELVRQMRKEFGVAPAELVGGLCPCAGPVEYEVGDDVRRIAESRLGDVGRYFPSRGGRIYFDMRAANAAQLVEAGLKAANIHVASASTMSDERFFSHRRDGADTGRFALIAGFRE